MTPTRSPFWGCAESADVRDDRTEAAFSVRKVVMLLSLVYMSAADEPFDQDRLDALLEHARARNAASGLSGLLVYKDGRFMQLLEGPEAAVLETYQRIIEDPGTPTSACSSRSGSTPHGSGSGRWRSTAGTRPRSPTASTRS